ncbi:uncharacterized protein H6S33_006660 [Morchella sextelata]|uniref:uncharacterized protein n=1 Tax=Morchella sextelata TaxID=1174677 RepID=UPI001D046F7B|nr:uncharacterized protein H6S33_006660 [Morchella sextelata]KAH0604283.1 hypothetical protein H6S33_006660 [Morchella sextelata]
MINEYSRHPRAEGSKNLDNSDIIAIVGIFASVIATVFGVWFLDNLRRRFRRSAADHEESTEGLEANVHQVPSSREPRSASVIPRQDPGPSTIQPVQISRAMTMAILSAPEGNVSPSHPRTDPVHRLEAGINKPKRAYTWTADKTNLY